MSLTSQIITADFPDLDKVEALNNEAFPEEERIPLSEFLRYEEQEDANFFAFIMKRNLLVLPLPSPTRKPFMLVSLLLCPTCAAMAMAVKSSKKLVNFYQRTMLLEIERLYEPCDNLEQRQARWEFYKSKGFRSSNAFLEYEDLSFEILY